MSQQVRSDASFGFSDRQLAPEGADSADQDADLDAEYAPGWYMMQTASSTTTAAGQGET